MTIVSALLYGSMFYAIADFSGDSVSYAQVQASHSDNRWVGEASPNPVDMTHSASLHCTSHHLTLGQSLYPTPFSGRRRYHLWFHISPRDGQHGEKCEALDWHEANRA